MAVSSPSELIFVLASLVVWGLKYSRGRSRKWILGYGLIHLIVCFGLAWPKIVKVEPLPWYATTIPLDVVLPGELFLIFARKVRSASPPSLQLFREPTGSLVVHSWRRFFLEGIRVVTILKMSARMLSSIDEDVYVHEYISALDLLRVVAGGLLEFGTMVPVLDDSGHLLFCEFTLSFLWGTMLAPAATEGHAVHVFVAFVIAEFYAWFVVALPVLIYGRSKRVYLEKSKLPPLRLRFSHFIAAQVLIEYFSRHDPQKYADRTILASFVLGCFHMIFKSLSVTYGGSKLYSVWLQNSVLPKVPMPGSAHLGGITSVALLRDTGRWFIPDAPEKLLLSEFVPKSTDKVVALSYKHHLPYINAGRRTKISKDDLSLALEILNRRETTHVWIDFVQNAHHATLGEEGRSSKWFEEGVSPFIKFEVVALWKPEEALDSMWIRIEEMCGLLGSGLYRAHCSGTKWTKGLGLDMRIALLQLGARALAGELADCRRSYNDDIDEICRGYGKPIVAGLYDLGSLSCCLVPDKHDFVYSSQITINMLIRLPGLLDTNYVEAKNGLQILLGREWESTEREHAVSGESLLVTERHKRLRVWSSRNLDQRKDGNESEQFFLICEASSFTGIKFRTRAEAEVDSEGRVRILRQKWLGERPASTDGLYEVDRKLWATW